MFPKYVPGKLNTTKLNTTIYLNAINDTGLGFLYHLTTQSEAGLFRLDYIRFRTPSEHTINN